MGELRRESDIIEILKVIAFLSLLLIQPNAASAQKKSYVGYVQDVKTGLPIEGAEVIVMRRSYRWRFHRGWEQLYHLETVEDGRFQFRCEEDEALQVIAYKADPSTPGYDYMPIVVHIDSLETTEKLNISLRKAATLEMGGMGFFVETTDLPSTNFRLLDPDTREPLFPEGVSSSFGTGPNTINEHLSLSPELVIVPANRPFLVQVEYSLKIEGESFKDEFIVDRYQDSPLPKGDYRKFDLREYTLPDSIEWVQSKLVDVRGLLDEREEEEGFFLAVERNKLAKSTQLVNEAYSYYGGGYYANSFTSLREAYIEISNLQNWITGLSREASRDIGLLVFYISVTSIIIANMLYDDWRRKSIFTVAAYVILLPTLFLLHPGSQLVSYRYLWMIGGVSIILALALEYLIPWLFNRMGSGASRIRMVVPLFSIAKRSLRRRKLRFFLTITSVLMLVASFIAFTSFTTGYGITHQKIPAVESSLTGVMVRTPNPPPSRATAAFSGGVGVGGPSPLDEGFIDFFKTSDEVEIASPKYESPPHRQYRENYNPYGFLEGAEIFGVIAISPDMESATHDLEGIILDGRHLEEGDEGMIIVCDDLASNIEASVGDTLTLSTGDRTVNLTLIGIIDGGAVEEVIDMDGESILPRKIIEVERIEQEGPDIVIEGLVPCNAEEVIIATLESEQMISSLFLNRINLILSDDINPDEYARTIAIDKDLRAWASASGGIYLSKIGGYFEGKGLPVVIPWIIVVMNVIVTMLNSYYERRGEMTIYSSIGMNPAHISGVFLAESTVIGIIGGSLGYILGMGTYRIVYLLTPALQVRQKVSILWTLAALAVSLAAVLVGGTVALNSSTSITPSLRRKWRAEEGKTREKIKIPLPVKIESDELEAFIEHILEELKKAGSRGELVTRMIREKEHKTGENLQKIIEFVYKSKEGGGFSTIYSKNRISVEKNTQKYYSLSLMTQGNPDSIQKAGEFVRRLVLSWSLKRGNRE